MRPDEPQLVRIGFEAGRPVSVDGETLGLVDLIDRVSELGCRHGIGIVDHLEDRIVGLKVRDIYEVPAATIILAAHADLEKLVSTIHQNNFKSTLDTHWAYLCTPASGRSRCATDLDAYMESANEFVTGEITVKLFKGLAGVVARTSPFALYDKSLAGFGESGGDFSQQASPGFIELFSLQTRMAHRVRNRSGRLEPMSLIYKAIGRLVVYLVRRRFGKQLQVAGAGAGGRDRRWRRRRISAGVHGTSKRADRTCAAVPSSLTCTG